MSSHRRGFTPRPVHVAPSRDFAFPSVLSSAREQIVVDRSGGRSDEWSCKENEMNYTIDIDNNIQAHAVAPATQDNVVAFTTEKGLANALGECGINRLVEIWNSFAGAPAKLFQISTRRLIPHSPSALASPFSVVNATTLSCVAGATAWAWMLLSMSIV